MSKSTKINKPIILASASPRRQELLEALKLDFIVHSSDFHEKESGMPAHELAIYNALGKAQEVARHYKNALIIGVDTVVAFNDRVIGKPKDEQDAREILRFLSNTTHQVISALCIMDAKTRKTITATETTQVTMDRLEETDIDAYIASGEGVDKAAGYAIQGLGSLYIKGIQGDYFNVVGLPVYRLRKLLREFGIKTLQQPLDKNKESC
jgi:septum formation protein